MISPKTKKFVGRGIIDGINERGYGFIQSQKWSRSLFFHANELINTRIEDLRAGDEVSFDIVAVPDRGWLAVNVSKNGWRDGMDEDQTPESGTDATVHFTIESAAKRLAEIIAMNPDALESLEWRDLERVIAVVFAGLGFDVELTRGSKDGGKDIILAFSAHEKRLSFLVEIKHWKTNVGSAEVKKFLHIVAHTNTAGGLMLASSGFSRSAIESLTEFERRTLRFGTKRKIVTLCKHYVKAVEGTWYPPRQIDQVITEDTV